MTTTRPPARSGARAAERVDRIGGRAAASAGPASAGAHADVDRVGLPDQVRAMLAVADDPAHQPLELVADGIRRRPRRRVVRRGARLPSASAAVIAGWSSRRRLALAATCEASRDISSYRPPGRSVSATWSSKAVWPRPSRRSATSSTPASRCRGSARRARPRRPRGLRGARAGERPRLSAGEGGDRWVIAGPRVVVGQASRFDMYTLPAWVRQAPLQGSRRLGRLARRTRPGPPPSARPGQHPELVGRDAGRRRRSPRPVSAAHSAASTRTRSSRSRAPARAGRAVSRASSAAARATSSRSLAKARSRAPAGGLRAACRGADPSRRRDGARRRAPGRPARRAPPAAAASDLADRRALLGPKSPASAERRDAAPAAAEVAGGGRRTGRGRAAPKRSVRRMSAEKMRRRPRSPGDCAPRGEEPGPIAAPAGPRRRRDGGAPGQPAAASPVRRGRSTAARRCVKPMVRCVLIAERLGRRAAAAAEDDGLAGLDLEARSPRRRAA